MKQQIENIIKKNLPEKVVFPELMKYVEMVEKARINGKYDDMYDNGFNQAISQINTSLIADEVLKVVVEVGEKYIKENKGLYPFPTVEESAVRGFLDLLSNLSPNKENKNNEKTR